jgi:serine/threonine protein phosphatase 1
VTDALYAIGDVHGQRALLEDALALIEADGGPDAPVVLIGDLVDRGPDARGVIELLMDGQDAGRPWTVLKGNHDRLFHWFMEPASRDDPRLFAELDWLHWRLGGFATLASYGVEGGERRRRRDLHAEARAAVPEAHLRWLEALPLTFETAIGGAPHLFVHAGLRPGVPLEEQADEDLLWIRGEWEAARGPLPWRVVHGHTSLREATDLGHRLNLDSGAGHGGPLTAARIEASRAFVLTPDGPEPMRAAGPEGPVPFG